MGVLHLRPDELEAQLELRRRRCRRVDVRNLQIELSDVQLQRDVAEPQFSVGPHETLGFITRLVLQGAFSGGYTNAYIDDFGLRELADAINTYLQRPAPPVQVHVQLHQPRPRRRKKAPPATLEQDTEVQLIKRRMMEGR